MSPAFAYILARLAERSTWEGGIAVASALGFAVDPHKAAAVITAGLAIVGLVRAFFPESGVLSRPQSQGPATPAQNLNP